MPLHPLSDPRAGSRTSSAVSVHGSLPHRSDPDEIQAVVSGILCPHHLTLNSGDSLAGFNLFTHKFGKYCSINKISYGSEVSIKSIGDLGFFSIQLQLSGETVARHGSDVSLLMPGAAAVLSPNHRVSVEWTADSEMLILRIEREGVEQMLATIFEDVPPRPLEFSPLMDGSARSTRSFMSLVNFLYTEIKLNDFSLNAPQAEAHLEGCLLQSLLYSQRHTYSEALERGLSRAVPRHVKRAEEYFHCHIHRKISIDEMASAAGVSSRTLFFAFKQFRSVSPVKYFNDIRLRKFRDSLMVSSPNVTIKEIAGEFGYTQLGRLSVEYKKKFGESPSETLRSRRYVSLSS